MDGCGGSGRAGRCERMGLMRLMGLMGRLIGPISRIGPVGSRSPGRSRPRRWPQTARLFLTPAYQEASQCSTAPPSLRLTIFPRVLCFRFVVDLFQRNAEV